MIEEEKTSKDSNESDIKFAKMFEADQKEQIEGSKEEPDCSNGAEMPKYRSHKEVWALKIKAIVFDSDLAQETNRETDGSAMITPEEEGYAPFKVDFAYVRKHNPVVGGYYVVYKDGYKSFSPADAFEEGNAKIANLVSISFEDGSFTTMSFAEYERMRYESTEYRCVQMVLDDLNAPLVDEESQIPLSAVGRIYRIKK